MKRKWPPLPLWDWLCCGRWGFLLYKMPITEELVIGCIFGVEEFQAVSVDLQRRVLFWMHQKTGSDFCSAGWVHFRPGFTELLQDKAVPAHSEASRWLLCQAAVCQLNLAFSFPWSMNRFFPQILFYFSVSSAAFFFPWKMKSVTGA